MPGTLPAVFGKYTLLRRIATGGMAEIFLAIQKSVAGFEKLVVVKRILPSLGDDPAFVEMLLHEARIAATLTHPNVVQIFDIDEAEGQYFIAMEHVHGEDLRAIVRQMKARRVLSFPLEHALAIVLGVAAGLAYAHERHDLTGAPLGIIHRDISPQNVLVTYAGDVKIVDFGIAKSTAREQLVTQVGRLKGKVPYMSPEQARGDRLDARSDVFATGILLFELTTGRRLFKGQSEIETLRLICDRDYPRPSDVLPGYPTELERIVVRALARDRADRYPTARALQVDLEAFVRAERIAASSLGLQAFMQSLFAEKLETEKHLLLQGKQLADVLARRSLSPEGESRSTTPVSLRRPATDRHGLSVGAFALIVVGATALGGLGATLSNRTAAPTAEGHLEVLAEHGSCAVVIDGRPNGSTPLAEIAVSAGKHAVRCMAKDGRIVDADVQVPNGGLARHVFSF